MEGLRTSQTSCMPLKVNQHNHRLCTVDLESDHAPLRQAILYTLGGVLLYHARNGALSYVKKTTEETKKQEEAKKRATKSSKEREETWEAKKPEIP